MTRKTFLTGLLCLLAPAAMAASAPEQWSEVESEVRDLIIPKATAQEDLKRLRPELDRFYQDHGCVIEGYAAVFPVEGYRMHDADTKGYIDKGYDFFSGKKHRDHPAVDIFIYDRNHDCLDDRTKKPVNVLSMSPGIVVSIYTGWEPGNELRGGNTVFVYDPVTKGLFYYAHMNEVLVAPGHIVKPGDVLGHVGRTGTHAYAKRSPTHLHVMYLKYPQSGYPYPENVSMLLKSASRHQTVLASEESADKKD
jgi:peptidoglycan LD-endopeptidase LytH